MTLVELAEARGISKASAARLVRRHRWRRQTDNTRRVRAPGSTRRNRAIGRSGSQSPGYVGHCQHLGGCGHHAARSVGGRQCKADRADAALTGERARAGALRDRLEAAEDTARVAREAADAPRQGDAARKARGLGGAAQGGV